jgi:hypothetical protein
MVVVAGVGELKERAAVRGTKVYCLTVSACGGNPIVTKTIKIKK